MRNGTLWRVVLVLALGLAIHGCQSKDENPNWDPATNYPDWTYDKPVYTEPAVEPKPYETVANNIEVYYSRSETFFIQHPAGKQEDIRPRTAVWYSYDGGNTWMKNGYYGLYQEFYTFVAENDGQYWIRFVGPGMGVAEVPPGQPHEIHVVDTQPPVITLEVDPPPFEEVCVDVHGNEVPCKPDGSCCCCHTKVRRPHVYHVGEKVYVHWTVSDVNLDPKTIELSTCFARFPHNLVWSRFQGTMAPSGSLEVVIPPEAASQAGMRFRVIARDKADNIGLGLSEIMDVQAARPDTPPQEESAEADVMEQTDETQATKAPPADTVKEPAADILEEIPEPAAIDKPRVPPPPLGIPEPPADLTEPVHIEEPASQPEPAPKTTPEKIPPADQGAMSEPIPLQSLAESLPETPKDEPVAIVKPTPEPVVVAKPAPEVKEEEPEPIAVTPTPTPEPVAIEPQPAPEVKRDLPEPVVVESTPEPEPVEALTSLPALPTEQKEPERTDVSLAAMERQVEAARQAKERDLAAAMPKPTPEKKETPVPAAVQETPEGKESEPVPVKVLAKAPEEEMKPEPVRTPAPPEDTPSPKPLNVQPVRETKPIVATTPDVDANDTATTMKLSDIPENVQQGWPARGMTMQGGVSRLLNWLPASAAKYETVTLQFSSNDGKSWVAVAKELRPGRVVTWTVPMVTSRTCRLRVVGSNEQGVQKTLETSEPFRVDAGKWETIDMSGFKMEIPKSK
ncbi:MAG: hypothetical protein JW849_11230 [Phycisphaerae bacterium]|nr:hypothetical protein [Phycisphaerae bacterium]